MISSIFRIPLYMDTQLVYVLSLLGQIIQVYTEIYLMELFDNKEVGIA